MFSTHEMLFQETWEAAVQRSGSECRSRRIVAPTLSALSPRGNLSERRRQCCRLLHLALPVMERLQSFLIQHLPFSQVCLFDGDFVAVQSVGHVLCEPLLGMTCGLAGDSGSPVQDEIRRGEVYEEIVPCGLGPVNLSPLIVAAAPLLDSGGNFIGVVTIFHSESGASDPILQMVLLAKNMIEASLTAFQQEMANYHAAMVCAANPLLLVDELGYPADANQGLYTLCGLGGGGRASCERLRALPPLPLDVLEEGRVFSLPLASSAVHGAPDFRVSRVECLQTASGLCLKLLSLEPQHVGKGARVVSGSSRYTFDDLAGRSPAFMAVVDRARRAASFPAPVLIEGESGTGKELLASAIHHASGRAGPFVAINCGALPRELLQSELFGYVEGAFTGACRKGRRGKLEEAHGGTLFLDEIGEMPPDMQVSLLRFLQEQEVTPLGAAQPRKVSVRVLAATHRDLDTEVRAGRFRADLYFRLGGVRLRLPSLSTRTEDILPLAERFAAAYAVTCNVPFFGFTAEAAALLVGHPWPGNVRELKNAVESALIFAESGIISPACLPEGLEKQDRQTAVGMMVRHERALILAAIEQSGGNLTEAARLLGIARSSLYSKLKRFSISSGPGRTNEDRGD